MTVGKNMNVKSNTNAARIIGRADQYLSPLGGGLQPASWVTRRQYARGYSNRNLQFRVKLPEYVSRSSSFGGVGGMYSRQSGRGPAFRHGGGAQK
tara:strand:- start:3161 stop:3445 length:285 start_codon:yes stop_codon:yes gene_type:complete